MAISFTIPSGMSCRALMASPWINFVGNSEAPR